MIAVLILLPFKVALMAHTGTVKGFVSSIWKINSNVRQENKENYDLKEYPNPASGMVSVALPPGIDGEILIMIFSLE